MALGLEQVQGSEGWRYHPLPGMEDEQFASWAGLIEARVGISLPAGRKSFLLTALAARVRALGLSGYQEYFGYLKEGSRGTVEWEALVDRLTVHETRFYRDPAALELIRDVYLRERIAGGHGPVRIDLWSAGCATGEEPYTLAMFCDQALAEGGRPYYFSVTATDISRASLAFGREGVYHRLKLPQVPSDMLRRHFVPTDLDHYQVTERLRERVCFTRLNLQQLEAAPIGEMDVIVCQNVLIYFRTELRHAILAALVKHLRPGGILILGAGEAVGWSHPALSPVLSAAVSAWRRLTVPLEAHA